MFNWLDAKEAEKFGKVLAQQIIERMPLLKDKPTSKAFAKQQLLIDKLYLQLYQFKSSHPLNIYKKAKLGSAFKYELINAGYDTEFINTLTSGLMQKL
jgi:hypothetical protein